MKAYLTQLGASAVVSESFAGTRAFRQLVGELGPVRLALNCVGGDSASNLMRVMAPRATMVTFGGMSKQPLKLPTVSGY